MSTISSPSLQTGASQTNPFQTSQGPRPHGGPRARANAEIADAAASGGITTADAAAMTSALDGVDAALASDRAGTSGASGARLDPSAVGTRVDGLIADQVSAGTLTEAQADTLKGLLGGASRAGGEEPQGGAGPKGAGGPPPGPPPGADDAAGDASAASASTGSTAAAGADSSGDDLLARFFQQALGSAAPSSGSARSGAQVPALFFDFRT